MYKFYKNIISKDTANKIYHSLLPVMLGDMDSYTEYETDAINGRGLGSYNFPATTMEIDSIKEVIAKDFGDEFEYSHSYIRIYPNNSVLHPHVDRPGLDLTLTVNIHKHPNTSWPFKVSTSNMPFEDMDFNATMGREDTAYKLLGKYLNNYEQFETEPGDGVCCTRDHVHWRDYNTLSFEGDHFVQCFYHWKLKS